MSLRSKVERLVLRLADPWVVGGSAMLTLLFLLFFDVSTRAAVPGGTPTLVDLQTAFTTERFADVLARWDAGIDGMKHVIITLDYLFPVVYAVLLSGLVAAAGRRTSPRRVFPAALPWVAAACDWIENSLHLWLLRNVHAPVDPSDLAAPVVFAASTFAVAKYALLSLSVLAGVGLAVRSLRGRRSA